MRFLLLIVFSALLFAGCGGGTQTEVSNEANVKRYELRGKVVSVDKDAKRARIDHEEIPDFMERMTMDFPIKEDWVWNDLVPGVEIRAELVVDSSAKDPYWLEKIGIIASPNPDVATAEPAEPEQIGKEMPEISLTDQNGKKFTFKNYRGKTVALTFIYRECPLPEFCIKMSRYFSDAANQIAADAELKDKVRLISVSFDPERDTPEKLKQYGLGYLGTESADDLTVWNLAVGEDKEVRKLADFLGLKYEVNEQNKAEINHNLVTAIIGPDGKVAKVLPGNRWTVSGLLIEIQKVAEAAK